MTRFGIAFIWMWTACASWFLAPHEVSLQLLSDMGVGMLAWWVFVAACVLDATMGILCLLLPSRRLWQVQCLLVLAYSLLLILFFPLMLSDPFGALIKNIAVVCCLLFLCVYEQENCHTKK